ncbi:MAG: type IX secretion system membrane protein PorP/SprF [Candidatus Hydrogenedentota bacterium]|nr:MAG: type IX secretion system membrane protein PorP/SprF [Candidatus Hydrogenedentota bacterium]
MIQNSHRDTETQRKGYVLAKADQETNHSWRRISSRRVSYPRLQQETRRLLPALPSGHFFIFPFLLLFLSVSPWLFGFLSPVHALGRPNVGTTGAAFLKIGVSPRLAALGGAYGALGEDVGAIFSNPAGLSYLPRKQAEFVHARLVADIKLNSVFYAHPFPHSLGTLALNYTLVDFGEIERTVLQEVGAASPFAKAGQFDAQDQALTLSYGDDFHFLNRRFEWGMSLKFLHLRIDEETSNGLAYDAGLIYQPTGRNYRFGVTLQNLGFLSKFREEADDLPLNLKLSAAGSFVKNRLKLALDANFPIDNSPILNFGAEFTPVKALALRAGYRFDNNNSDFKGYTAGLGIHIADVSLDYAYTPFELLGNNHRFALGVEFGAAAREDRRFPVGPVPPKKATTSPTAFPSARSSSASPTTPARKIKRTIPALRSGTFTWRGGPEAFEWIAEASPEVFRKHFKKQGLYHRRGRFLIDGSCQVADGVLYIQAVLHDGDKIVGVFESSGDPNLPFSVWEPTAKQIDGRIRSLGLRPLVP